MTKLKGKPEFKGMYRKLPLNLHLLLKLPSLLTWLLCIVPLLFSYYVESSFGAETNSTWSLQDLTTQGSWVQTTKTYSDYLGVKLI